MAAGLVVVTLGLAAAAQVEALAVPAHAEALAAAAQAEPVAGSSVAQAWAGPTASPGRPSSDNDGSSSRAGATPRGEIRPRISSATWLAYRRSIFDATVAMPSEIAHNLVTVAPGNRALRWRIIGGQRYVLMQTLRRDGLGQPGQRVTLTNDRWLSVPSQVAARCAAARCSTMSDQALDLRLKQMIGLPPDGDYRFVNQFWVRPADLFRPCTDPRILTTTCPAQVPTAGPTPAKVGGTDISKFLWIQTNYAWRAPTNFTGVRSFSCAVKWLDPDCYGLPWTRLGYSYDWRPGAKEEGPSEFVAVRGASVVIDSVRTQRQVYG